MHRRPAWSLVICFLAVGCGYADQRPPASGIVLHAVELPDLSVLAEPVQRQVRERFATLSAKRSNGSTPRAELAEAHGDLGRLLLAARLGAAAESCFLHAQALAPRDHRWPYYLGHAYLFLGDRSKARSAFEQTLSLAPGDVSALIWLAESHLDDGRPDEAEAIFLKAGALQPRASAAHFGAGRAALARQAYSAAAQHFEQALALAPDATAVHYPLAMAYRGLGDRQKADAHLAQRGEAWPALPDPLMEPQGALLESVTAYERRGVDALATGDLAAAAAAFRKGLEIEPGDPALRHRLGKALYAAGDAAGAVREFEEVVRRSPDFAQAQASLGTILTLRGQFKEAIERFSAALSVDADSVEARLGLAEALRVSGQAPASIRHYDRAIRLDPAISEAWVGKALALIAVRRHREAREWLAEARRLHPDQKKLAEIDALVR